MNNPQEVKPKRKPLSEMTQTEIVRLTGLQLRRQVNERVIELLAEQDPADATGLRAAVEAGHGVHFARKATRWEISFPPVAHDKKSTEAEIARARFAAWMGERSSDEAGADSLVKCLTIRDRTVFSFPDRYALQKSLNKGLEEYEAKEIHFPDIFDKMFGPAIMAGQGVKQR